MAYPIKSFKDLEVWKLAMDLVDLVIAATDLMPHGEFDLRRQIRRAVISIPSNVAEGYRRKGRKLAYQNYVSIAMGSQGELDTELEIAFRNHFLNRDTSRPLVEVCDRVGAMLYRLHDSLG